MIKCHIGRRINLMVGNTRQTVVILNGFRISDFLPEKPENNEPVFSSDISIRMWPTKFINADTWLKHTKLLCKNCTCECKSIPRFIPSGQINVDTFECTPIGPFCRANCAVKYAIQRLEYCPEDANYLVSEVEYKLTGIKRYKIPQAPDASMCLAKYCGIDGMTEAEYHKLIDKLDESTIMTERLVNPSFLNTMQFLANMNQEHQRHGICNEH